MEGKGIKPHISVSAAIIFNDHRNRILITQRNPGGPHGNLWEFPGGKIEVGETPRTCLHREILEELGIHLSHITLYVTVTHEYPAFSITLHAFTALIGMGTPCPIACQAMRWVRLDELSRFTFPEADQKIIKELERDFSPSAIEFPVTDVLDLHTFHPRDVRPLLKDFLERCGEEGIDQVRIIHGKGTGTLKRIVHGILKGIPTVKNFYDAPEGAGGWGATIVELVPTQKPPPHNR